MKTKRSGEGYFLIDHQASPGLTPEWAAARGVGGPIVGKGQVYESAICICGHCGGHVLMNPMRKREREWCQPCDRYLCDICGAARKQAGYVHRTRWQIMLEMYEQAMKETKP